MRNLVVFKCMSLLDWVKPLKIHDHLLKQDTHKYSVYLRYVLKTFVITSYIDEWIEEKKDNNAPYQRMKWEL